MENQASTKQSGKLLFLGLLLFLLGLIIGLFVHNMANPRMALSAHLEGVMNGIFLMVLGLIWKRIRLSKKALAITFWLAVYGTFANLAAVIIAAVTGFGKMMPLAGGQEGPAFLDGVISFLLVSLSLCMVAVCILSLTGVYRHMKQGHE
ncbi:hydrogenase [Niabella drilacis]|uniref:Hydroxylaminobenzene mutase n=1 Tax=Niabella drilacis (strain DSM 25811 / CCM 8410 / CCUG 62505 / LMG 26954 / E90) TaxID=1285928 RepID=A0A1G7BDN8_NIADE|nr:hydrogenase [Niabella drilacis]SDE25077.1 hydroxylaminobenzene mutase [Niabella drilacis]